ncbi:MAG: hypothetical protein WAS21_01030 [Geminicoccaceae bacterium]
MNKYVAIVALPLLLGAGIAKADEVVGKVEQVDASSMTVVVGGQPYIFESQVAPLKFSDVKVGEKVRLQYNNTSYVVYQADHAE